MTIFKVAISASPVKLNLHFTHNPHRVPLDEESYNRNIKRLAQVDPTELMILIAPTLEQLKGLLKPGMKGFVEHG